MLTKNIFKFCLISLSILFSMNSFAGVIEKKPMGQVATDTKKTVSIKIKRSFDRLTNEEKAALKTDTSFTLSKSKDGKMLFVKVGASSKMLSLSKSMLQNPLETIDAVIKAIGTDLQSVMASALDPDFNMEEDSLIDLSSLISGGSGINPANLNEDTLKIVDTIYNNNYDGYVIATDILANIYKDQFTLDMVNNMIQMMFENSAVGIGHTNTPLKSYGSGMQISFAGVQIYGDTTTIWEFAYDLLSGNNNSGDIYRQTVVTDANGEVKEESSQEQVFDNDVDDDGVQNQDDEDWNGDADGDGIPNYDDDDYDSDGDGKKNGEDNYPYDDSKSITHESEGGMLLTLDFSEVFALDMMEYFHQSETMNTFNVQMFTEFLMTKYAK